LELADVGDESSDDHLARTQSRSVAVGLVTGKIISILTITISCSCRISRRTGDYLDTEYRWIPTRSSTMWGPTPSRSSEPSPPRKSDGNGKQSQSYLSPGIVSESGPEVQRRLHPKSTSISGEMGVLLAPTHRIGGMSSSRWSVLDLIPNPGPFLNIAINKSIVSGSTMGGLRCA